MAAMLTFSLPTGSVPCPGPWPRTSAEGEYTRRNSQGRRKREPSSKATSSTCDFWCRVMSVGLTERSDMACQVSGEGEITISQRPPASRDGKPFHIFVIVTELSY